MGRGEDDLAAASTVDQPTGETRAGDAGVEATSVVPAPRPAEAPPLSPGAPVGRYVVLEVLGRGGMAVVYKAYDPELDRSVALKLMQVSGDRDEARARLLREAQALAQISHPNVISVFDVGVVGDGVFMAMELVEGETLRAWMRQQRDHRAALAILLAAGDGIAAAHQGGLVHRDFKPENVLVGRDGRVRVVDFGLARRAEPASSSTRASLGLADEGEQPGHPPDDAGGDSMDSVPDLDAGTAVTPSQSVSGPSLLSVHVTRLGRIVGTPAYMAPEQHEGAEADARSDQFSFCATLYEALYGRRPFRGRNRRELRASVTAGAIRPPPSDSRVPAWIRRVVERGLAAEPGQRYPSMDTLLAALRSDPRARWRRRAGAAAVLALAGVAAVSLYALRASAASPCAATARGLEGVWDENTALAVSEAFEATAHPLAGESFARVRVVLDDYRDRWLAMSREVCEATHVRREQSVQLSDLRNACLRRRRDGLRGLAQVLREQASPTLVERAVDAALALDELDRCADTEALLAAAPLPQDPRVRERIEEHGRVLGRVRALQRAGLYADALTLTAELRAATRDIDHAPLHAETLWTLGDLQSDVGKPELAEATLLAASRQAAYARDVHLLAQIWLTTMWVVGYQQGRVDDAILLGHVADTAIAQTGDDAWLRQTRLHREGTLLHMRGRYDQAAARYREAITLAEAHDPAHPRLADLLASLGNVLAARAEYAGARAAYERAWNLYEGAYGPEHPRVTYATENLGSLELDEGRYLRAREHFARTLAIVERAFGAVHPDVAHALLNLGSAARALGDVEGARASEERALAIYAKLGLADSTDAALATLELARIELDAGETARALALAERARTSYEEANGSDHPDTASAAVVVAEAQEAFGQTAPATRSYQQALATLEAAHGAVHPALLAPLVGLARLALAGGDENLARRHGERAREIADETLHAAHPRRAAALQLLAEIGARRDGAAACELVRSARTLLPCDAHAPRAVRACDAQDALERSLTCSPTR